MLTKLLPLADLVTIAGSLFLFFRLSRREARPAWALPALCAVAALALFAERGVAATSLREVARSARVAPGLVGHYFGSKDGLQEAVEDAVVGLFHDALGSVPLDGPVDEVVAGRDAAVNAMFRANPHAVDYLRRVVVTPGAGDGRRGGGHYRRARRHAHRPDRKTW